MKEKKKGLKGTDTQKSQFVGWIRKTLIKRERERWRERRGEK